MQSTIYLKIRENRMLISFKSYLESCDGRILLPWRKLSCSTFPRLRLKGCKSGFFSGLLSFLSHLCLQEWLGKITYSLCECVQIRSFFWSVFSRIGTEYGERRRISPYLVRMRENTDTFHAVTFFTKSAQLAIFMHKWLKTLKIRFLKN